MGKFDLTEAKASDMTNLVSDLEIDSQIIDGVSDQLETTWINYNWSKYWGYFNSVPDLKSAIIMKAIWNVGKGFTTDISTEAILDNIRGWGKDTFGDILFNMEIVKRIGGDSFAEIIRNKETGTLVNLKPLDPGTMKIVVNKEGIIIRYEQISKIRGKKPIRYEPNNIFHLTNNRLADQIHGISDIEGMEKTILANEESFEDLKKLMHHQVKPFILWKLKTDDPATINALVKKIDKARNLGEDMFIPDDDDSIDYEIIQVNLSSLVLSWRDDIRNKFYRTIMLPQVVPGGAGQSTESESKVIYLAFEQLVEKDQRYIEGQLWNQLAIKIDLIPPASIKPEMQTDERKDATQGLGFQKGETTAGVGE